METSNRNIKENLQDLLTLSPMQKGMLFHYLRDDTQQYFEQLSIKIAGRVDNDNFRRAWKYVVDNNPMLRTVFRWEKLNNPVQIILRQVEVVSKEYDFSATTSPDEQQAQIAELKARDRLQGFDLEKGPLLRVMLLKLADESYEMIVSNHHIILDGWSTGIILKEFFAAYDKFAQGQVHAKLIKCEYKHYLKWLAAQSQSEQEAFWCKYLQGFDTKTNLPTDGTKNRTVMQVKSSRFALPPALANELTRFVGNHQTTLGTFFNMAWGLLLQRYTDSEDVIFGTTVAGRPEEIEGIEEVVGLFINTLPLRVQSHASQSVRELLVAIHQAMLERQKFECTPLVEVKAYSEIDPQQELFDSLLVLENYPLDKRLQVQKNSLQISAYAITEMTNYDLVLEVTAFQDIEFKFTYNTDLFDSGTIEQINQHLLNIIRAIVKEPSIKVGEIEMISPEEKAVILGKFNDTQADYPMDKTIYQLFEEQAAKTPENPAIVFGDKQLTYGEFNARANHLARTLRQKGVGPDQIVGIMAERSFAMLVGIMAILKAGGAYLPIDPMYPAERISYMLADSDAKVLLTTVDLPKLLEYHGEALDLRSGQSDIGTLEMETADGETAGANKCEPPKQAVQKWNSKAGDGERHANLDRVNRGNDLAYVIYTSGSTGKPKGVMIEHQSLVNRLNWMQREYHLTEHDTILHKTPFTFDVSVWEIFWWSMVGARLCLLGPGQEKDPEAIVQAIEQYRVTTLHFVPSMLNAFLESLEVGGGVERLTSLRQVFASGEALSAQTVRNFSRYLGERREHGAGLQTGRGGGTFIQAASGTCHGTRLHNLYGPTEATVDVTYFACPPNFAEEDVPIGRPIDNTRMYVLNRYHKLQPVGIPGELWIAGIGLSRGYLKKPELTTERFIADPFYPGERMYRTGDLAYWLADGNLVFLGRIDHQVKIRGFRIELGEIEKQLVSHPAVKEAVVIDKTDQEGMKYLCAYVVTAGDISPGEFREYLARELPDYMLPAHFIRLNSLPLSPNGKLDRKALPAPDGAGIQREYVAPANQIEERLATIWARVLGVNRVGVTDNFFELGGHSLKATTMIALVHKELEVNLPLKEVFRTPTIKGLSEYIEAAGQNLYTAIPVAAEREYYPVSSAQKRLFLLAQLEGSNIAYNMTGVLKLQGTLDRIKLKSAIAALIQRHESLRTSFALSAGEPVARVHEQVDLELNFLSWPGPEYTDSDWVDKLVRGFVQPFDLSIAPLLRVGLVEMSATEHLLILDMHHIISDGISLTILINDFQKLYQGEELTPLRIQYKDFALWQNTFLKSDAIAAQEKYWLERFASGPEGNAELPVLNMPTDFPRPKIMSFQGDVIHFTLEEAVTSNLNELAARNGVTLYMLLLAAFNVLLAKYTGQTDLIVGSPIAGRPHTDLANIIGMFVNTLAMRNFPVGEKTFLEFLAEVKENALRAYENQDYQFEMLIEKLSLQRNLNRNALFEVMFALQNTELTPISLAGVQGVPLEFFNPIAKFDLTLIARERSAAIAFDLEFSTQLFKRETVLRLSNHFVQIIQQISAEPTIRLAELDMLSQAEKTQLLSEFNQTAPRYIGEQTLQAIFEQVAEAMPNRLALTFKEEKLTYQELNQRANSLAKILRAQGIGRNSIVGLMVERSTAMLIGIIGILKAGAAYLPIIPGLPTERIRFMLEDAGVEILLTQVTRFPDLLAGDFFHGQIVDLGGPELAQGEPVNPPVRSQARDLAQVIYTSGTTGKPKGVLIRHFNITRVVKETNYIDITPDDVLLQLSNYAFDGSTFDIFGALLNGARLVLIEQETILDPLGLAAVIESAGVTVFFLTTALFNTLVDTAIDCLANIRKILFGGERASSAHVEKALQFLGPNRIIHMYGPTESTVFATYYPVNQLAENESLPIGRPLSSTQVYIVNPYLQLQPIGVIGELCIGGDGLAAGYLQRDELTREKFVANPHQPGELMYKTGDLARWRLDGNIEFIGRIDHQVKIRGFRIELGEIECLLLSYPDVQEVIVVDRCEEDANRYLCAYLVAGRDLSPLELRAYLGKSLPDYMIPSYFIQLDRLPLTPNGKVDRKALPAPDGPSTMREYVAPTNPIEKQLVSIWEEVLGVERVGVTDNFFELGGHSLKATVMIAHVHRELAVNLPLKEVFKTPTVQALSQYILAAEKSLYTAIPVAEEQEYYPVSSAQKRLFVLDQLGAMNTAYNLPLVLHIEGQLQLDKLERALNGLIQRHESLRTSFAFIAGEPVQRVQKQADFKLNYVNLTAVTASADNSLVEKLVREFVQPFDLSVAPLFRVELVQLKETEFLLFFDLHHIIADGTSLTLVFNDFQKLYQGEELAPLRIQYKDFALWQNELWATGRMALQESYWLDRFGAGPDGSAEVQLLNLPTDYPRPGVPNYAGDSIKFALPGDVVDNLSKLTRKNGATLYMCLLAAFNVLLAKYSGQEELTVGSPVAGRPHADLQNIIGMFVNTLAMRNFPTGGKTFANFLAEVKENTLKAFENQDYPFELLIDQLNLNRDVSRNPLFDVMFALQNVDEVEIALPDLQLTPLNLTNSAAKFDLVLNARETADEINCMLEYKTSIFKESTMKRLIGHFTKIVKTVTLEPEIRLADIEMLSLEEKAEILDKFNATRAAYPEDRTIYQLFEEQVTKTPENEAIVLGDEKLTYAEFNARANQLARTLRSKGVRPDQIVGIMAERSCAMIVGIMAILKAGGAYLPIDPAYPAERISYMLADSDAELLLTTVDWPWDLEYRGEIVDLRAEQYAEEKHASAKSVSNIYATEKYVTEKYAAEKCTVDGAANLDSNNSGHDLAYVIYTSGSTGKPKGVMIEHHSLVNRLNWMQKEYHLTEQDTVLHKTPFTFDVSVWEIFWWSMVGARLCLLGPGQEKDPEAIVQAIEKYEVTTLHFVPSMLNAFLESLEVKGRVEQLSSLRQVFASGEALSAQTVKKFYRYIGTSDGLASDTSNMRNRVRLHNLYGPTEATVDVTYFACPPDFAEETVPIGRPIANTRMYVLDRAHQLQPVGIPGELWIAGVGLSRGYLKRPELTAERFIPDPFSPGERMYKTGDLAQWLPDGNLAFLGRIDHQVKIRGFRIEPGEIEKQLLSHPEVREAVVIDRTDDQGMQYLCAYVVSGREVPIAEFREYLAKELPDYMLPSYFIRLDNLPLSPNGKLDRKALPAPTGSISTGREYVAPVGDLETKLAEILAAILGMEKISMQDNFFELGGHSLKATRLIAEIYQEFQVQMPLQVIFELKDFLHLATWLKERKQVTPWQSTVVDSIRQVDAVEGYPAGYFPTSSAQRRLFVHYFWNRQSTAYNMPTVFKITGDFDEARFRQVIGSLVERHAVLRTSFELLAGQPVQKIEPAVDVPIEHIQILREDLPEKIDAFIQPFDLKKAPLFRIKLLSCATQRFLLVDMHHIISDGISLDILTRDFSRLYQGEELPELSIQYKDFASWQRAYLQSDQVRAEEEYWLSLFKVTPPALQLSVDRARPAVIGSEGETIRFEFAPLLSDQLKRLALENNLTLYLILLTLFKIVLVKYSGAEDLVVGSPIAGRQLKELENLVGCFVNTLAIRSYPARSKTFRSYLQEVREIVLSAFAHQDYPFEMLVEKLQLTKDLSRNPLFDTMFVLQPVSELSISLGGLTIQPVDLQKVQAKFDLTLSAIERENVIAFELVYNTSLFAREFAVRLAEDLRVVAEKVLEQPDTKIGYFLNGEE